MVMLTLQYGKGLTHLIEKLTSKREEYKIAHTALWTILTAFRGPDIQEMGHSLIKESTTQRIRNWVIAFDGNNSATIFRQPRYTYGQVFDACGEHFARHLRSAERTIQQLDPKFAVFHDEKPVSGD